MSATDSPGHVLEYRDGDAVVVGDELVFAAYVRSNTYLSLEDSR